LYQPKNRLQLVLDHLPALIAFLKVDQCYVYGNRLHFSWFGIDPASLAGRHIRDVIGEDAYQVLKPGYEKALSGQDSIFMGEVPFANGGKRFIHGTAVPLFSDSNVVEGILLLTTDLTEQKLIEKALDATTLRSQTVLDTAVDGIVTIDDKGIIQSCNTSLQKQFGYSANELIGQSVNILMPSPHRENHDRYLQRYLNTGEKRIIGIGREVTGKRKDGSEFPMELSVGEFMENGRYFFTGFARDITDRKRAEHEARTRLNELAHVTRQSAMGDLASGIAHEINQPLTAIVTMAQAMLRSLRSDKLDSAMVESTLEKIARQGVRSSTIINQMREFISKGNIEESAPHNIDVIISNVLQLLEHEIDSNKIRVNARLHSGRIIINVNRIQIEQVVMNLVQNAIDAMADVPRERILTINTSEPQQDIPYVEVSIEDNGSGLPDEHERIFEPFFSTKINGMGQGLSICRSIIESHGGTLSAFPNYANGTVFSFTLPTEPAENRK